MKEDAAAMAFLAGIIVALIFVFCFIIGVSASSSKEQTQYTLVDSYHEGA